MRWFFAFLAAAIACGVVGFGFADGTSSLIAKLAMIISGGLAIVLFFAKPGSSHDENLNR